MTEDDTKQFLNGRVVVLVGDITRQQTDAIVNAANSSLMGGAGVDGAIHRAGGAQILEACHEIRRARFPQGLPTGGAVITTGGRLPARHVIHTVGPIYGQHAGREAELLASCYQNSLALAVEQGLASIAFPAISTGVYGYPREEAAAVSSTAIRNFLDGEESAPRVHLVFFKPDDMDAFLSNHRFD
ncbi:MAG: O-acetyl-ADP-ribose deacetylase [Pyrinomonadaceae bacterium]